MNQDGEIGQLLRQKRLEFGWSVETVAELYGNAVNGHPITGGAVFNMEEGTTVPKGEKRRWVLARIFNIPPTVFGLTVLQETMGKIPTSFSSRRSQSVDVSEYEAALESYRTQGYRGSPELALQDLGQRIYALQDNAFYVRSPQRDQMKRLLCKYLVGRSGIARELSYESGALDHLNKAVILAQEEKFADLEAYALFKRGEFFFTKRAFPRALREFKEAQSKMEGAPREVRGAILDVRGLSQAYLAQTEAQFSHAMKLVDVSGKYVTSNSNTPSNERSSDIQVDHTEVQHLLTRAEALVAPADTKIHLSEEAYQISDAIFQKSDPAQKRRHVYHSLDHYVILAQYYLDKGYYSMAVAQTENALLQSVQMNVRIYLPTIVDLYEQLTKSSYSKTVEVAELGLRLLFVQYPSLGR